VKLTYRPEIDGLREIAVRDLNLNTIQKNLKYVF